MTRDERRRATYQRILAPGSGSSEAERGVAAKNLAALDAEPADNGTAPLKRGPDEAFDDFIRRCGQQSRQRRSPADDFRDAFRAGAAAQAAQERARQADPAAEVERQRRTVEAMPFWRYVPEILKLHECATAWDAQQTSFARRMAMKEVLVHDPTGRTLAAVAAQMPKGPPGDAPLWGNDKRVAEWRGWIRGVLQSLALGEHQPVPSSAYMWMGLVGVL